MPEPFAVVRRIAIAEGAADQGQVLRAGQLAGGKVGHRAQLHGETAVAQARRQTLGQGFGIAGLRGPEQCHGGRVVGDDGCRSFSLVAQLCDTPIDPAEQPTQDPVQPQASLGSQRRAGRQHRHPSRLAPCWRLQATEKTGEVGAFTVVQWRGGQATDAREIGKGLDARHGEFLW
ncbi:hypothetical protein D9M71_544690 [compost metagenome]